MTCMKSIILLVAILIPSLWICTGCSYTYRVTFENEKPKGDTVTVTTLNRRLGDRSSTIEARDGKEHEVSGFVLTRDSCLFTDDAGGGYMPTSGIHAVRRVDHLSGAVGGFFGGIVGGFVLGLGVGYLAEQSSGNTESRMVGIIPMALGPIIGLGVGVALGTRTEYFMPEVNPDSTTMRHSMSIPTTIPPVAPNSSSLK